MVLEAAAVAVVGGAGVNRGAVATCGGQWKVRSAFK